MAGGWERGVEYRRVFETIERRRIRVLIYKVRRKKSLFDILSRKAVLADWLENK